MPEDDWFQQNKPQSGQQSSASGDWFSTNAPSSSAAPIAPQVQPPIGTTPTHVATPADTKAAFDQKYPQAAEQPGAVHRFLSGAWDAATGVAKTAMGTDALGNAVSGWLHNNPAQLVQGAAEYAKGPVQRLGDAAIQGQLNEGKQAVDYAKQGRYSEAAGHGLAAITPSAGPMAADIAETAAGEPSSPKQVGPTRAPNLAGALGKAVVAGAGAALGAPEDSAIGRAVQPVKDVTGGAKAAVSKALFPVDWKDTLVRGVKPRSTALGFADSLDRSVPEMKAVEPTTGPIQDVDSALDAVKAAKQNVWSQYEQAAGPARAINSQVDLSPVADAMEKTISPKLELENPARAKAIRDQAAVYRTKVPLADAESYLKTTNAELDSYHGKYPATQRASAEANPDTATLVAQGKELRNAIYANIDGAGEGAAPRELKQRYGALLQLEEELERRKNVAARQQPDSLTEQMGKVAAGIQIGKGAIKALTGNPIGAAQDVGGAIAGRQISKYVKEQQTTNALIKKAFENYDGPPPAPVTMPTAPTPAGLLGPGAIRMPGDTSGPVPFEPHPGAGMAQNAGNRTLPPAGSPIRNMPPVPDTSGPIKGREPRPGAGVGQTGAKELPKPSRFQQPGFATGTLDDAIPTVDPETGKVTYVPKWYLQRPGKMPPPQ